MTSSTSDEGFSYRKVGEGGEGGVYLAKMLNPKPSCIVKEDQLVCVKIPHITGRAALESVLEEASAHIQIQERLLNQIEHGHIAPFIGFSCELPTVVLLVKHFAGGDLCKRLERCTNEATCTTGAKRMPVQHSIYLLSFFASVCLC